jgi:hypothetical protein
MENSELETLLGRLAELEDEIRELKQTKHAARPLARLAMTATVAVALALAATPSARAQFGLTLAGLNGRLLAVEAKTAPLSLVGTDLTFTGVNVHIRNGEGRTNTRNELGNLIVGYNGALQVGNDRSGSHNLVVGDGHTYASYGGLVAGVTNSLTGPYATVTGGSDNVSGGLASSVSGGRFRAAFGSRQWAAGSLLEDF